MDYITAKEATVNWGVTVRHVRYYVHKIKFKELFALEVIGQYLKIQESSKIVDIKRLKTMIFNFVYARVLK